MKTKLHTFALLLFISASFSLRAQSQTSVKNFSGIVAGGPIDVIVTMGNTEDFKFEGDSEAISTLLAQVEGSTLVIRPSMSWKSWERKYKGKKITAYVNAKNLSSLTMSGSGSMRVKGNVNAGELSVILSGSGILSVATNAKNLNAVLSGSGNLNISGEANDASITLSGSATFAGKKFSVRDLSTQLSGSGKVNIEVSDSINAVISGSASIYYTGNAEVKQTVLGSGKVVHL